MYLSIAQAPQIDGDSLPTGARELDAGARDLASIEPHPLQDTTKPRRARKPEKGFPVATALLAACLRRSRRPRFSLPGPWSADTAGVGP